MSDTRQAPEKGKQATVRKSAETADRQSKPVRGTPASKTTADKAATPASKKPVAEKPDDAAVSVKWGALIVFLLIGLSLVWYLVADRYSPYTTQARVEGYIVGVAPKVSGLVTKVYIKNNQEVAADQLLFEIDRSQYQIALNKARSDLESAKRQLKAGDASVSSAEANLRAAKANEVKARQDLRRLTRLHTDDPGTISVRRIEVSKAALEQAQAGVTAAQSAIEQAIEQKGGNDDDTNSFLKSAQSAVAKAELDLANTRVTSSSRGVISTLIADVGQYATAGSPVMTLVAIHDVWISAEFTENNLGHMQVDGPVEILFDVFPGKVFSGSIRSIGLGVSSSKTPAPGTLPTIENDRDWLRQSQRFPVLINFDVNQYPELNRQLRVGGQASVIAYADEHGLTRSLGEFYIRLMSWLSYAY